MNQAHKSKFARTTPAPKSEPAGKRDWWVYRGEWEAPVQLAGPFGSEAIAKRYASAPSGAVQYPTGCRVRVAEISERAQILARYLAPNGGTLWIGGGA